jgi:hypothetical protein
MEFQLGKNTKLVTSLEIGQKVINYCGGYKTRGETIIEDIKRGAVQTGIVVKTKNYNGYVDSDWINNDAMLH